jgi:hypothetical protein
MHLKKKRDICRFTWNRTLFVTLSILLGKQTYLMWEIEFLSTKPRSIDFPPTPVRINNANSNFFCYWMNCNEAARAIVVTWALIGWEMTAGGGDNLMQIFTGGSQSVVLPLHGVHTLEYNIFVCSQLLFFLCLVEFSVYFFQFVFNSFHLKCR